MAMTDGLWSKRPKDYFLGIAWEGREQPAEPQATEYEYYFFFGVK
jgi:hypothetical protein